MESNIRKIFILAFVALILALAAGLYFVVGPRLEKAEAGRQTYVQDKMVFDGVKNRSHIMLENSMVQVPSPAQMAKANLDAAKAKTKELLDKIKKDDEEFESFFKDGNEVRAGSQFREVYQQRMEKKLLPLLNDKGVYNQPREGGKPAIQVVPGLAREPEISEWRQKALQKQTWIYQRLIYSLLKLSYDGTPLVRELVPPSASAGVAMEIKFCDEAREQEKADKKKCEDEPLFYGGQIPQITVSFSVILDERHVGEFIDELRVYNRERKFRANFTAEDQAELDDIKPVYFQEQRITVTRLTPGDQYTVPKQDDVVVGETRAETRAKIKQLDRLVKMDVVLNVLDCNPNYKER